jgi:stage III sporulation protein AG
MNLPSFTAQKPVKSNVETQPTQQRNIAQELTEILSQIQGVGKVQVMLTVAKGEQTVYQVDESISDASVRTETVILTTSDRAECGLISQVLPETFRGAIIVCQGGDKASVKLAVLDAVSKATGLDADCISVLKMK